MKSAGSDNREELGESAHTKLEGSNSVHSAVAAEKSLIVAMSGLSRPQHTGSPERRRKLKGRMKESGVGSGEVYTVL